MACMQNILSLWDRTARLFVKTQKPYSWISKSTLSHWIKDKQVLICHVSVCTLCVLLPVVLLLKAMYQSILSFERQVGNETMSSESSIIDLFQMTILSV